YQYNNGFLHSKTLIVDDEIATVGTANMDNRSFTLNFEVNAFIYDEDISLQLKKAFIKDMKVSYELTKELYNQRSTWIK
ncbi:phospholipase D-like domain-containing protein, partial [Staphylococcus intermedius]